MYGTVRSDELRSSDRHWRNQVSAGLPLSDQCEGFDPRALTAPAPSTCGMIRLGVGEAQLPRERRQYLDSGME
jgi:hypothetical protein